jgi:hypothetical protein
MSTQQSVKAQIAKLDSRKELDWNTARQILADNLTVETKKALNDAGFDSKGLGWGTSSKPTKTDSEAGSKGWYS